jgi:hypothetical protein
MCVSVAVVLIKGLTRRLSSVYLLHAYDYCPNDPMICLGLAISSMGRAMQRQSDNRHHLIAQVNLPQLERRIFGSRHLTSGPYYRQWRFLRDTGHSARRTELNRTKLSITLVVRFSNSVRTSFSAGSPMLLITLTIGVGLHSLAVKHYEHVLDIAERKVKINPDVCPTP